MPLDSTQIKLLTDAISGYSFPAAHYDFAAQAPIAGLSMTQLETRIQRQLLSQSPEGVKDGLSNVLYWGFAKTEGRALHRAEIFRSTVTPAQLEQASRLFSQHRRPALDDIARLGLPQFSGVSFVSKVRMYLDPVRSATLDLQIMKIHQVHGDTVLAGVNQYSTRIPVSAGNSLAYEHWCDRLNLMAHNYLPSARAVDIERGLFHLIQSGRVAEAAGVLKHA